MKVLVLFLLISLNSKAFASGCSFERFMGGELVKEIIISDLKNKTEIQIKALLKHMHLFHSSSLQDRNYNLDIKNGSHIQLVSSTYNGLDTDCGWSRYGSKLEILRLKIITPTESFYYPDIYTHINAENLANNLFIKIRE